MFTKWKRRPKPGLEVETATRWTGSSVRRYHNAVDQLIGQLDGDATDWPAVWDSVRLVRNRRVFANNALLVLAGKLGVDLTRAPGNPEGERGH